MTCKVTELIVNNVIFSSPDNSYANNKLYFKPINGKVNAFVDFNVTDPATGLIKLLKTNIIVHCMESYSVNPTLGSKIYNKQEANTFKKFDVSTFFVHNGIKCFTAQPTYKLWTHNNVNYIAGNESYTTF